MNWATIRPSLLAVRSLTRGAAGPQRTYPTGGAKKGAGEAVKGGVRPTSRRLRATRIWRPVSQPGYPPLIRSQTPRDPPPIELTLDAASCAPAGGAAQDPQLEPPGFGTTQQRAHLPRSTAEGRDICRQPAQEERNMSDLRGLQPMRGGETAFARPSAHSREI